MMEMAVQELGIPQAQAGERLEAAARAEAEAERALLKRGQKALAEAVKEGKLAIVLAGHSYNAFAPEASQSVARKLSSMGVTVVPSDCLAPIEAGPTAVK